MKTNRKILVAAGAGLAIGGILGVLFAPESGADIRKKISGKGKRLADDVKNQIGQVKDSFQNVNKAVKDKMEKMTERVDGLV
jgi:gas vesicle protein